MIRWPILAIFWNGYPPSQITGSTNCCRTTGSPQNNNTPKKELGPQGGLGQGVFTGWIQLPDPSAVPCHQSCPRVEIYHEPEELQCNCGCALKRVSEDVTEKLDYIPGRA